MRTWVSFAKTVIGLIVVLYATGPSSLADGAKGAKENESKASPTLTVRAEQNDHGIRNQMSVVYRKDGRVIATRNSDLGCRPRNTSAWLGVFTKKATGEELARRSLFEQILARPMVDRPLRNGPSPFHNLKTYINDQEIVGHGQEVILRAGGPLCRFATPNDWKSNGWTPQDVVIATLQQLPRMPLTMKTTRYRVNKKTVTNTHTIAPKECRPFRSEDIRPGYQAYECTVNGFGSVKLLIQEPRMPPGPRVNQ